MSPAPVRVLSKAIFEPSGENAGSRSLPGPWLTRTPFAPSGSAVTIRALGSTHAKPPFATGVAARAEPARTPVAIAASARALAHAIRPSCPEARDAHHPIRTIRATPGPA